MSAEKIPLDIKQVREQFEAWRATKSSHRELIPDHLWSAACALLDDYSLNTVCQQLRLNARELRKHQQGVPQRSPKKKQRKEKRQFLELNGVALLAANNSANNDRSTLPLLQPAICQLMLEKKDGSRLTISLPLQWPGIEALCLNLLRDQP